MNNHTVRQRRQAPEEEEKNNGDSQKGKDSSSASNSSSGLPHIYLIVIAALVAAGSVLYTQFSESPSKKGLVNEHVVVSVEKAASTESDLATTKIVRTEGGGSHGAKKECSIWMAPTSQVGNTGYGIFTTRRVEAWEPLLQTPDAVSIPVIQLHYHRMKDNPAYKAKNQWHTVWDNYWWGRGISDHASYEDVKGGVIDYQVNFGSLPNHHCVLDVLDATYGSNLKYPSRGPAYDDNLVTREDPGAGAFSYSIGRDFYLEEAMEPGQEIFLNYGYCEHTGHPKWTDHIFMTPDFIKAATLIMDFLKKDKASESFNAKNELNLDEATQKLIAPKGTEPLVAALLPQSVDELKQRYGSVTTIKAMVRQIALQKSIKPKTAQEIKSEGMCVEHLKLGVSTLPHAGHGGIAQHVIKKGEMVVPAPLMQIPDRKALELYDPDLDEWIVTGQQLVLNYCFGHSESSLLLCPNTNAILINHCSHRRKQCGPDGPNAEYRWANSGEFKWDPTSDEWRNYTLEQIGEQPVRGLSFEIVATRDIAPGDEVFIDYGPEWEEAWEHHVETWKPPPSIFEEDEADEAFVKKPKDHVFVTAREANDHSRAPIMDSLISGDLRKTARHPYLFTGCQYWTSFQDYDEIYQKKEPNWRDWSNKEILKTYADDGSKYGYHSDPSAGYSAHRDQSHWPCEVLYQDGTDASGIPTYTVRMRPTPFRRKVHPWYRSNVPRILTKFSRRAMHHFVRPQTSDQFLPNAFRHHIGIRDEIFPEHWKDLKAQQ